MKDEDSFWSQLQGGLSGLLIFAALVGFNVLMFYICIKIFGWKI